MTWALFPTCAWRTLGVLSDIILVNFCLWIHFASNSSCEHSLGPNTKYESSTLPIISHISLILYFVCLFFCLFVYLSVSCKDCASSALPIISHLAPLLAPLSESGGAFLVAAPVAPVLFWCQHQCTGATKPAPVPW